MDVEKEKTQTDPETNVYYVCTYTCIYTLYIPRNIWDTEYIVNLLIWCKTIIIFLIKYLVLGQITKTYLILLFFIIKNPFKTNKQPWNTTKTNSKDSNVSRLNSCRRINSLSLFICLHRTTKAQPYVWRWNTTAT